MFIYSIVANLPTIVAFGIIIFILWKLSLSFYEQVIDTQEGVTLHSCINWLDPYKQTIFYYKYTKNSVIVLVLALIIVNWYYLQANKITPEGYTEKSIFLNLATYLPNYLVHEFSHRFTWVFKNELLTLAAGNIGETLFPLTCFMLLLRVRHIKMILPFFRFWIATTLYDAGTYMGDASSCKMALTSSDMVTSYNAGQMKGDWYHIFNSLGILQYDYIFANILYIGAASLLVFTIFSIWYFFTHIDDTQDGMGIV